MRKAMQIFILIFLLAGFTPGSTFAEKKDKTNTPSSKASKNKSISVIPSKNKKEEDNHNAKAEKEIKSEKNPVIKKTKPTYTITPTTPPEIQKLIVDEAEQSLTPPVPAPPPAPINPKDETNKDTRSWTKSEYKDFIAQSAEKHNIDPQVIYATIMTESEGDKYAFRYEPHIEDASLGLGQILTKTAQRLGLEGDPKKLYEPEIAIDYIGKYHKKMLDEYGELTPVQLATAYNTGSPFGQPVKNHIQRFNEWLEEKAG